MKYCINLKKRKNKPYCKLRKESIKLAECRNCNNKEYKKSGCKWRNCAEFSAVLCKTSAENEK